MDSIIQNLYLVMELSLTKEEAINSIPMVTKLMWLMDLLELKVTLFKSKGEVIHKELMKELANEELMINLLLVIKYGVKLFINLELYNPFN